MTNEEVIRLAIGLRTDFKCESDTMVDFCNTIIKVFEQQPKVGHWIDMGSGQECSECREIQYGYDNFRYFCPNCGADMRGDSE